MIELTRTIEITRRSSSIARSKYQRRSPRFEPRAMMTVLFVADVDFIGQFVHVARSSREVLLEMLAGGADRLDDSVGELPVLETNRQLCSDFIPESGGNFLVDSSIAEDDELPRLGGDEKQHAIAQAGFGHTEALECALGEHAEIGADTRLHMHANLA